MATATKATRRGDPERDVYSFTLILSGIDEINEDIEKAIYDAGCDDALLGMTDGQAYLTFDRESDSLKDAIIGAIHAVENCGKGWQVVEVVPPGERIISIVNAFLRLREEGPTLKNEFLKELAGRKG